MTMSRTQEPLDTPQVPVNSAGLDAPACLFGLSLADAFRKFVLDDPRVIAVGRSLVQQERMYGEVFSEGHYPGPWIDYGWRLDVTQDELAFQFVRPIIFWIPG